MKRIHCIYLLFLMTLFVFLPRHPLHARAYGDVEEEVRPFKLRELSGTVDLRFEYEDDREKGLGRPFRREETRFEERLSLKTQGSIYHPNLLQFDLGASAGLRQQLFRGDLDHNKVAAYPYEYNANLNFLQNKPYGFNLFAHRMSNPIGRNFFETIDLDSETYGGSFRYQNRLFPMNLLLQRQNTKEDAEDFKRERTERVVDYRITNRLEGLLGNNFRYVYKDLVEEIPSRQEITSHDLSLNSTLDYKPFRGYSNISYLKTLGSLATDQLRVTENYQIDHSKTFSTLYNYNFSRFITEDFRSRVNLGGIGFRHKLYDSLVTEVRGEVSHTKGTDFREDFFGPTASFSYRKKVPGGVFSGGYNFLYRRTKREAETGVINIFGERVVLSDGLTAFLSNPNVIPGSVIVRDTSGVVLTLDLDYRLIASGILVEIRRVALPNNTPVLVDYEFSSPQSLRFETVSSGVTLRYDFQPLFSLYYNYLNTQYDEISKAAIATTPNMLTNILKSLYGAELKWRWFNIVGEYEDDDSDLIPFAALRVRGSFNTPLTDYAFFSLNANHSQTEYEKDGRRVTLGGVDGVLRLRLNSFLEGALETGYLRERGRDLDTRAWKFKGDLKGQFRSIEMRLQSEYLRRHELTRDRNEWILKINLIRRFSIL